MALPPLELFSLKKRPPRCRVASSLFRIQLLGDCEAKSSHEARGGRKKFRFDLEAKCEAARCWSKRGRWRSGEGGTPYLMFCILRCGCWSLFRFFSSIWPALADEDDLEASDLNRTRIWWCRDLRLSLVLVWLSGLRR